ncbi:AT-hook motif nuclear-localized protein 10-like [Phoenix dactylifera]|uniref:AT-hook motif nuclear-localized protein 10-like n=1 Tax=Phoenix dactylifera TaxID=42345 RepID=A0A8B9ANW8_PHODC|nr:AT-hook motif nuclear-localized protein 10-like [Phoenix dactylifera]
MGGLSASFSLLDGCVLGGVPGVMTAASPAQVSVLGATISCSLQVVLGSFIARGREVFDNSKEMPPADPASAPPKVAAPGDTMISSNPPSQGTLSGFSGIPVSPAFPKHWYLDDESAGVVIVPWR